MLGGAVRERSGRLCLSELGRIPTGGENFQVSSGLLTPFNRVRDQLGQCLLDYLAIFVWRLGPVGGQNQPEGFAVVRRTVAVVQV